ncbi:ABC transporter ATP-binding protein [Flavobacterium noncentrifugens]|uniref:Phospholipid/cholesterol/gamma-HCH transport system ATP-binding protein n=1 Tax=Flavobacterium noncentrifugens TaxID=1128970 RepID=A0A1G8WXT5_9FLAO|nr:ATP-binding cassette domain-containing protein [Flavobacterium noncentrifugens]GEP51070.1 ABC transporter ATP-binding protein [Flavobacterium noncentrifugens]SDJ82360.1 phospholipid/cholesterol/gamma-HCH transport system ATP-binding protein [Flavobacterium noncentrifugens]
METQPIIAIKNLWKSFGKNKVLRGINLTVDKGESLVILGRSGSGKSVTIECLVGLLEADKGKLEVFGTDITKLDYKALNRIRLRIGFLFQGGALYDSMSVRENLAFTLKHHTAHLSEIEIEKQILEALDSVGLQEAIDKMPSELSGGMVKRIGLARTLIIKPEIILYDEPTAGLDTITAKEISELILSVQKKYKTTSLIITHDINCAKMTGNRIMIIKDGVIHAQGSYDELMNSPDDWVRSFFV